MIVTRFVWLLAAAAIFSFVNAPTVLAQDDTAETSGLLTQQRLKVLLEKFPAADTDRNGKLSIDEAKAFRQQRQAKRKRPTGSARRQTGAPRNFKVDPGWQRDRFPDHAVCYKSPSEIKAIYAAQIPSGTPAVVSYDKPTDGALRIVATGHSFMGPGFRTFPLIAAGAGLSHPFYAHTGGGITGSARYKWEQENGIFSFDGEPLPKLLASISNAEWDVMMWGPYFNDQPEYYSCWINFCLQHNPGMKFYLSDAWPQLMQLTETPQNESFFTAAILHRMGSERREITGNIVKTLRKGATDQVFILPTCDAMVLAGKYYLQGKLPGIEGIHRVIGNKERSLWVDRLGHIGPGFDRLEGYVFYATIYGRSPELITGPIKFRGGGNFPSDELDQQFREIAWKAVTGHPLSGVTDNDGDGVSDAKQP